MFRLLSRSRRLAALLAASALGIAPLAAGPVTLSRPDTTVAAVPAGELQELQVELAWMTDPVTFRCPIRAHATSSGVELTGFVPSADAHKLAVDLAREICGKRLRDAIRVSRLSSDSYSPAKSDAVVRAAKVALHDVLGQESQGIEVRSPGDGKVILRGPVASLQEKHAVSSRLRRLSGCSCVVNLLEVPGAKTGTVKDASKKEPGKLANLSAKPLPEPAAQPAPAHRSVIQRVAAWVSPYGGQSDATAPDKVIASTSPAQPARPAISSTASPYGGSNFASPYPTAQPLEQVPEPQSPWASSRPPVKKQAPEAQAVVQSAVVAETVAKPLPQAEPLVPLDETRVSAPTKTVSPPSSKPPRSIFASLFSKPETVTAKSEPSSQVDETRMPIATSSRSAETISRSWDSAPAPPVQPTRPNLFATVFGHSESPAAKAKIASPSTSAIPDRPYVTTGTVIFHDEVPPPSELLPSPDGLRQKLLQACNGAVKDVEVKTRPDGGLHVTLKVASESAIQSLTGTVLLVPEMQSPRVHLSCEVTP